MPEQSLSHLQLDAIREMGSIGAGHAATALSRLSATPVKMSVPNIWMSRPDEALELIGDEGAHLVGVYFSIKGRVGAGVLVTFEGHEALALVDILMNREPGRTTVLGPLERSVLEETANIMLSSFLTPLSTMTGFTLIPSTPDLRWGARAGVLAPFIAQMQGTMSILFRTDLRMHGKQITSNLLMIPDSGDLDSILEALAAFRSGT